MSKFTPAPWNIFNTADIFTNLGAMNAKGIEAPSKEGWHIADCDMGGLSYDEIKANTRLICAAPDLYEILFTFIEMDFDDEDVIWIQNKAREALKKAGADI